MTALLELTGIGRRYPGPPGVTALEGVDLTIAAGEYCAITGPSGSGKSTLLNLLGLLDRATAGSYRLAGRDTAELADGDLDQLRARTFGFVFQSASMMSGWSVAANVGLGLRAQGTPRHSRPAAVAASLDVVGLTERAGAKAGTLSGGERQRAAIARALCGRPAVLLADEPTGNLDSANAAGILQLFDDVHARGVTVLVITHDPNVAGRAQRRIEVRDGRLRRTTR